MPLYNPVRKVLLDDGTSSDPSLSFLANKFDGFYHLSTGVVIFTANGTPSFLMAADTTLASTSTHRWAPDSNLPGSQVASNTDVAIGRLADGILKVTRGDLGSGGAIKLGDPGTRPAAGATYRGTIWIEEGAGGVADTFSVCIKSATDTYSWVDFVPADLLDGGTHRDTLTGTVVRGDIIIGNSTPKWSRKAVGTGVLVADGTDVTGWTMTPVVTSLTASEIDSTSDLTLNAASTKTVRFTVNNVLLGTMSLATDSAQILRIDGSKAYTGALNRGIAIQPTMTLAANADAYGTFNSPTFADAGSGTNNIVATLGIQTPNHTGSGATITNAAACYIEGEPAFGTNSYALLVNSGKARLNGQVGIGGDPATSAALEVASTTGAILIPRMTTTQKNALTAVNGMIVYDSTLGKFQGYEAGAWANFSLL